ncbi:transcription antitermination factor NusB [Nitrosomonas sp. Nm51]|uniref:transcription antitermination factor NusB n=1 Tax=Nitrosomonas sp. Nm51 TaxID=133720 RepID=UPI000A878A52|nr:transcription antitermination factor NusB [Nitrosomonas sp. Nm51]
MQTSVQKKPIRCKSRRRIAREFVLQGIYQWRLAGGSAGSIEEQLRQAGEFIRADELFFTNLFKGVMCDINNLEKTIQPFLDRSLTELSPVEYAILLLSTYELIHFLEVPYRAIINEAIELARTYGGSDGYKYVNGVLDKLAVKLRVVETASKM